MTEEYKKLQEITEQKGETQAEFIITCDVLNKAQQEKSDIEEWVEKTEEYYDALVDTTEYDLRKKRKQLEDLFADAEKILKMQNTASNDDLSRKAYMQKIKYKDGTTAEERYQKMLQQKQQEQEHRQQNLLTHRDNVLKKADKLIQDVENTDRFDSDYGEYI